MLSRPTTQQILLDCREELLHTLGPALAPGAARIAMEMMENVLRNCAARAAHEIAWMREEGDAMLEFAAHVSAAPCGGAEVSAALEAHATRATDSLHLDAVTDAYGLASACFEAALDAAMAAGDANLTASGRAILDVRLGHEMEIMGEWTMVGRA